MLILLFIFQLKLNAGYYLETYNKWHSSLGKTAAVFKCIGKRRIKVTVAGNCNVKHSIFRVNTVKRICSVNNEVKAHFKEIYFGWKTVRTYFIFKYLALMEPKQYNFFEENLQ